MAIPPKPRSEVIRPELTRLPEISPRRRVARTLLRGLVRLLVRLFLSVRVDGLERLPKQGPMLIVTNHLGDADALVGIAIAPTHVDLIAKAELYDLPILGKLLDAYGVIWVHRGQPDRRAVRAALDGLNQGRIVGIAPEGRESLTGGLEEGTSGAAFLAIKSGSPLLPVSFVGTENWRVFGNIKKFRRTPIQVTVGHAFYLDSHPDRHKELDLGTRKIMQALARLLPLEYQGAYRDSGSSVVESQTGSPGNG